MRKQTHITVFDTTVTISKSIIIDKPAECVNLTKHLEYSQNVANT